MKSFLSITIVVILCLCAESDAQPAQTFDPDGSIRAAIGAKYPDIQRRLAGIEGHDRAKATVRYPFDLARALGSGERNYNAFDLGLGTTGQPNYFDFAAGINRSEELLSQLEAGNDPLYRAKGDHARHYVFPETGEILPYHVYVPSTWDGKTPLPLIFILHGNTRNQDFYFEREDHLIPRTAETHGYMLAGPLGYHPNGGYNAAVLPRLASGAGANPTTTPAPGSLSRGRGGVPGGQFANNLSRARIGELSEADTMHVFELIKSEYPIDPKRTFLFGYSAGGAGTYYLGAKFADSWAAIATGGGTISTAAYPYDRLQSFHIPVHIFYGSEDSAGVRSTSQTMAKNFKDHGIETDLVEYKGFNHDTTPGAAVAHLFDFFDAHPRK